MNLADSSRLRISLPQDLIGSGFYQRCDAFEVASSAGDMQVHRIGHLGIVGPMTLAAVSRDLFVMIEFSRSGMADRAGNILMGGAAIRGQVDQRIADRYLTGIVFARGAMAMEAETGYRFDGLRIFGR